VSTDPADPAITVSWPWRRGPELPLWTSGTTGFAPSSPSEGVISPRSIYNVAATEPHWGHALDT